MIKKLIVIFLSIVLCGALMYNVIFLYGTNKEYRACDNVVDFLTEDGITEEPLGAYIVEKPNVILLATKKQAQKITEEMTLRDVIALIGKPQRLNSLNGNNIVLQWDLKFNSKVNIEFKENSDKNIYRWCDRLNVASIQII